MGEIDVKGAFSVYALKHHTDDLIQILEKTDPMQHYSVIVNFVTLFEENIDLGNAILGESETTLPLCDEGLLLAQKHIFEETQSDHATYYLKSKVHTRITGLRSTSELQRATFPRNEELGIFLKVTGTIVKATLPKLLEFERAYRCNKCSSINIVAADFHLSYALKPPSSCSNHCIPIAFTAVKADGGGCYKDYQEVKVQEELGKMHMGTIPSSIWVTLDHDLVDTCHPGDHVTVWGTATRRWRSLHSQEKSEVELVVKANNLQVSNDQKSARLVTDEAKTKFVKFWEDHSRKPLVGRDLILASFCPEVYGLYLVKLAMCIVLAGGVPRAEEGGSFVRAESHLLLVGDPGTGKSHLLRFASRTAARAVLTTGVGSTSAGLTVCAVREGSDWQLEAGALVLADGGVCCIDELGSIREQDRTSIHEAMEQQTISVAKAGMVTKLNTRCAIIAATNAKGQYDPSESLCINVALASPLLSRFDLILVLQDTRSEAWDSLLSSFILELSSSSIEPSQELWNLETLQTYFAVAKTFQPEMTKAANIVLSRYYQAQRCADSRNAARTTVRMLESLVRLSQGHARLMMHREVTLMDAVVAVTLVECSMAASALISAANALHAAFPTDPQRQYQRQAEMILKKLNLNELMEEEIIMENCDNPVDTPQKEPKNLEKCTTSTPVSTVNEPNPEFSQRFTSALSNIKKKKDLDTHKVASIAAIRKHEMPNAKKRKIQQLGSKILEKQERKEDESKTSDGTRKKREDVEVYSGRGSSISRQERLESTTFVENRGSESCIPEISSAFCDSSNVDSNKSHSISLPTNLKCQSSFVFENGENRDNLELNDSVRGSDSRTCHKDKSRSEEVRIQSSKSVVEKLSAFKFRGEGKDAGISNEGKQVNGNNRNMGDFICDKSLVSSTPLPKGEVSCFETSRHDSVNVPTPLLTNEGRPVEKYFNCDKLKALAKLGRTLSQTQSSRVSPHVSVEKQPSQFVLNELSWDDLSLDL